MVFYALCFPYLLSFRRSVLLVADIGQGTHPCTFGVCFDDQDSGGFHKKDYRSVPRRKGFGEEKRRMLLCFLSLICVVERKERKEVAKNRLLCFDWGCRTRAQFIIAPQPQLAAVATRRGISRSIPLPLSASLCPLAHNGEFIRLDPPSWAFASAFLSFFAALSCVELGSSF